jgi:hypothetical protein
MKNALKATEDDVSRRTVWELYFTGNQVSVSMIWIAHVSHIQMVWHRYDSSAGPTYQSSRPWGAHDHEVVVASAGGRDEASCLVGVYLAGGLGNCTEAFIG